MVGLILPAPDEGCKPFEHRCQGYGHHDNGQLRLADQGAHGKALDCQSHEGSGSYRQDEGSPQRKMKDDKEGVAQVPAYQYEVPLGDVEGVRALHDNDEAYGYEGIDHAQG